MTYFWLSFVNGSFPEGERFRGVAIIAAPDMESACKEAWRLGCNPGGEVAGFSMTEAECAEHIPLDWIGRLVSSEELHAAGHFSERERSAMQ